MFDSFKDLTKFERTLWISSLIIIGLCYIVSSNMNILTCIASLIGVTALIFVSKGYVLGQVLTVVFAIFYRIISYVFQYYGEMITYLCMTSPIALMSVFSWLKHPYKQTKTVEVYHLAKKEMTNAFLYSIVVTFVFFFILKWLHTSSLFISTLSITTSFLASYLTYKRSPYYALAYSCNDIVLIILWVLATLKDTSYFCMIVCFIMFLSNDLYGYFNWSKLSKSQNK